MQQAKAKFEGSSRKYKCFYLGKMEEMEGKGATNKCRLCVLKVFLKTYFLITKQIIVGSLILLFSANLGA